MSKKLQISGRHGFSNGKRAALDPELMSLMRLVNTDRFADVESLARRILGKRPAQPLAMKALSFALVGLGRCEEVLPVLEAAIRQSPFDAELYNNQGIAFSILMRWQDSIESFSRARTLTPNDTVLLKNMGAGLVRMSRWDEAVPLLLEAIEKHPGDYIEAIFLVASALINGNRLDEAWVCLQELHKDNESNLPTRFLLIWCALRRCHWDGLLEMLDALRVESKDFSLLLHTAFPALSFPGLNGADHRRIAEAFARETVPSNAQALPHDLVDADARGIKPRLRIAYLSGDLREHAVGLVIPEVIERHDRSRVEVFAYSTKGDSGSDIRKRLMAAFDQFVDVENLGVPQLVDRIRADRIDILIDLNGWTAYGRPEALALRCAPVQVNWLGYAGTMGSLRLADYILGDPVVTPMEHQAFFSETIAQMPHCYMPADTTRVRSDPASRQTEGLPETAFVFCSFNNSYKYNPTLFDLWADIMRSAPDSVLWLSNPGEGAATELRREMQGRGVEPVRLVFANRVEAHAGHIARLQLADLALDPFPYNSHSTGVDTLWAGVPMVALKGDAFASRVGASTLGAVGLGELVATTPQEYREIALGLYGNPQKLVSLRKRLADGRDSAPLFDMTSFSKNLERLYFRMWQDFVEHKREPIILSSTDVDL